MSDRQELRRQGQLNLVRLLAVSFTQPHAELGGILANIKAWVEVIHPQWIDLAEELQNQFCAYEPDITNLTIDYTKLFLGPSDVLTPPYASFFLDPEHRLMTHHTMVTQSLFLELGLKPSLNEPPDHIVHELELILHLLMASSGAGADSMRQQTIGFLADHCIPWLGSFSQHLIDQKFSTFYAVLSRLTFNLVISLHEDLVQSASLVHENVSVWS